MNKILIVDASDSDRRLLDIAPYNLAHSILVGQYGADEIPYGAITGRKGLKPKTRCMNFEKSVKFVA